MVAVVDQGVTIVAQMTQGDLNMYASFTERNPDALYNDAIGQRNTDF